MDHAKRPIYAIVASFIYTKYASHQSAGHHLQMQEPIRGNIAVPQKICSGQALFGQMRPSTHSPISSDYNDPIEHSCYALESLPANLVPKKR